MKFSLLLNAALCAGLSALPLTGTATLLESVRPDAAVVLHVRQLEEAREHFARHPLGRTLADPSVQAYLRPVLEHPVWRAGFDAFLAEARITPEQIVQLLAGEAALVLGGVDPQGDADTPEVSWLLLAALGPLAADVEERMGKAAENLSAARPDEEFHGVTLRHLRVGSERADVPESLRVVVWTVVDGLFFAGSEGEVKTHIARRSGDSRESVAGGLLFRTVEDRLPGAQVRLVVNLDALLPGLFSWSEASAARKARENGAPPRPPGALAQQAHTFGLSGVEGLHFATRIGEAATEMDCGLLFNERRGIFGILSFAAGAPMLPDFVSTRWLAASEVRFDFRETLVRLEEFARTMSPMMGAVIDGQLQQITARTNVDVRRDIIGALRPGLTIGQVSPAAENQTPDPDAIAVVFALPVDDMPGFQRGLSALLQLDAPSGTFVRRDYLGFPLHGARNVMEAAPGQDVSGLSMAFAGRHLLLGMGRAEALEPVLQDMRRDAPRLRSEPRFLRAVDRLPPEETGVSFTDTRRTLRAMLPQLLDRFEALAAEAAESRDASMGPPVFGPRPDADTIADYWNFEVGSFHATPRGWFLRNLVDHP